ncbi:hypothetical protein KVR01_004928 [Diaporthe batatas]|uniref:uncharacterized protein n=1 Tax=Diaporthe batatas TaxID=748121 RepID=UPI001D04BD04|nr:uncharacterized protein KVR01_004928 [Diaporthe batatas]KAG8164653.1 hypothetical protein KVR01_004928 [Diaporthe batatas]
MNGGGDKAGKAPIPGARANGRIFLPSFALNAPADATSNTNGVADNEKTQAAMASGAHSRKHSQGSLPDAPDSSRIPRPSSRASPQTRRPFTITEATDWAKSRLAQGSPSPAPRPARPGSVNSDHRPLPSLFTQRPIDLGRLGTRRPPPRRDGTSVSKDTFGSSSHKGDVSDDELDRKLKQYEEDEKIIQSMKEDKKGLFNKPKFGLNGTGTYTKPSNATSNGGSGDGGPGGKDPRQSWVFAETGHARPDWIKQFKSEEQALDFAPGRQSRIQGFSSFGNRVPGSKRISTSQSRPESKEPASAIPRPATVAPIQSPNKSYAWQVDEDFTAGDLQVSNSPPVSYGRTNTRLDEIRRLEIDAELDYPIENHRFVPQRTNTKLDEILQREKDAERKYPVPRIEEPSAEPAGELFTGVETKKATTTPSLAEAGGGSQRSPGNDDPPKEPLPSTRLNGIMERGIFRAPSPKPELRDDFGRPHQTTSHVSHDSKTQPQKHDYNGMDGEKVPNTPVTIYRNRSPTQPIDEHNGPNPSTTSTTVEHATAVPRAKEDSHDLLRRLSRVSSNSPIASPENAGTHKAKEEDRAALSNTGRAETAGGGLHITEKADQKFPTSLGTGKSNALSKPTIGFAGLSRTPSTKSMSSTQSRASADPTARIEGEMKLFALMDNMSERGSVRAPSPRPDIESEPEDDAGKADETPRAPKFDPLSMPTPQVTGAYVETPVTVKTGPVQIKEEPTASTREPEKKAISQAREISTSPRSTKSDGPRSHGRSTSFSKSRRSRSTPRKRFPLRNSVKPPTVEEDLKQIHLSNNIDESTTDDFDDFVLASIKSEEAGNGVSDSEDADAMPQEKDLKRMEHMGKALSTGLASIRQAKKGIGRLEDRVAQSEQAPRPTKNDTTGHEAHVSSCLECAAGQHSSGLSAHVALPVPSLWRTQPKFKITWLGKLLLLLTFWYVVENNFYDHWGRQYVCYRGSPCRSSPDNPDYGYVVPVKLDEWLTGGMVRPHAAYWLQEAWDLYADVEDWWTGTDLRDVRYGAISDPFKREQYFRRIQKKGLQEPWTPKPAYRALFEAYGREALAEKEAEDRGEPRPPVDERMGKDDVLPKTSEDQEPPRIIWF